MNTWQILWSIIQRELKIISKRPIYLLGSVAVLAFCSVFFLSFFSQGLPSKLPIGVVDNDHSTLSRNFARQLDATQLGKVIYFDTYNSARKAMTEGKITSICVIPENMYKDVVANRQPVFTYYINSLYFVGGALAYKDILTMINLANGAVKRSILRAKGFSEDAIIGRIKPIQIDVNQIGNPYTNYGYYLINVLLPGVLEMIVIIILIYALGSELKFGTSKELLDMADGSITLALTGKLIVYTLLFCSLGVILIFLLYYYMKFPIYGSIWSMILNIIMLVFASEGIAIFILSCLPITRLALSIGALYSVLGFSLSGFTLPVESMPSFIRTWAMAYPLRHYYLFYVKDVLFGTGFYSWWPQLVYMMIFMLIPVFVLGRLKRAYQYQHYPKE